MGWLPSRLCPPLPYREIDWKLRAAVGRRELTRMWMDLWWSGVAAGRVEGVVGTLLVVLLLAVMGLFLVLALRGGRK
jgi:hypothetical protein